MTCARYAVEHVDALGDRAVQAIEQRIRVGVHGAVHDLVEAHARLEIGVREVQEVRDEDEVDHPVAVELDARREQEARERQLLVREPLRYLVHARGVGRHVLRLRDDRQHARTVARPRGLRRMPRRGSDERTPAAHGGPRTSRARPHERLGPTVPVRRVDLGCDHRHDPPTSAPADSPARRAAPIAYEDGGHDGARPALCGRRRGSTRASVDEQRRRSRRSVPGRTVRRSVARSPSASRDRG